MAEVITLEVTPEYQCVLYNKAGDVKKFTGLAEKNAALSTGEWFNRPYTKENELSSTLILPEDGSKPSDAEIENQLAKNPTEIHPRDRNINAVKNAVNTSAFNVKVGTVSDEAKDLDKSKKDNKGK